MLTRSFRYGCCLLGAAPEQTVLNLSGMLKKGGVSQLPTCAKGVVPGESTPDTPEYLSEKPLQADGTQTGTLVPPVHLHRDPKPLVVRVPYA